MKKLFWIFLTSMMFAQTTPNIGLNVPNFNAQRWDIPLNNNWNSLDSYLSGGSQLPHLDFAFVAKTVATLPSATLAINVGRIYRVTDGSSSSDCTVGGGSFSVLCISNGSIWQGVAALSLPQVAAGSVFASTSVSTPPAMQTKPYTDIRDWGVDCTGATDAAAILNAHTNLLDGIAGQHIVIPNGCLLKLTTEQWQIYGNEGWEIEGTGILGSRPMIQYCGPAGRDSSLKIERSGGWTLKGVTIQDGGSGCANTTPVGLILDNDRSGGYTMTNGVLDRVQVVTGSTIANWVGIYFAPVANSNTEDIVVSHSLIGCGNATGAVGINLSSSFNVKEEDFDHTQIVQCPGGGIAQTNSGFFLRGMDTFGNTPDIIAGAGSDPTLIEELTSESPQMISVRTNGSANYPFTLQSSHMGWAGGGLSAGLCGADLTNATGGDYLFIGDGFDTPPTSTSFPVCASTNSNLTFIGSTMYQQTLGPGGNGTLPSGPTFILPNGHHFGNNIGIFKGGRMRMGNEADYGNEDIGYGFLTQFGVEIPGYSFNAQSLEDGHVPGNLNIGKDVMYMGNQNITFKAMWPIPTVSISCAYTGTAGSTQWMVEVFPVDAAGKRGGLIAGPSRQCGSSAASTLSVSNFLTVVWPRVTNAVSYDVVLLNFANINLGLLFGNMADPGTGATATTTITSGSTGSTFNYVFPNFYDSAITTIYGESFTVKPLATFNGGVTSNTFATATNCAVNSASPAACGSAANGAVVIPTTTASYTVNTTAVTSHSRIQLTWLTFASDLPSAPTCVAPVNTTEPTISAVSAGVSFAITLSSTTGQTCVQYDIKN